MEKFNIGYSTKNIPLPSQHDFLQRLIEKTEQFLRRMRWKAYFFLNRDVSTSSKDTYGFKSTKNPPPVDVTTKHLNLNFPQLCNLKVYSRWFWIFLSLNPLKSERSRNRLVGMKVYFFSHFLYLYITLYLYVSLRIYYGKIVTQASYIYIYIYSPIEVNSKIWTSIIPFSGVIWDLHCFVCPRITCLQTISCFLWSTDSFLAY